MNVENSGQLGKHGFSSLHNLPRVSFLNGEISYLKSTDQRTGLFLVSNKFHEIKGLRGTNGVNTLTFIFIFLSRCFIQKTSFSHHSAISDFKSPSKVNDCLSWLIPIWNHKHTAHNIG